MNNKLSIFALTVAIIALALTATKGVSENIVQEPKKETAFERIIRTGTIRCGYGLYVPELVKDPNTGALSGNDYDVMNAVGAILGLKVEWAEETGWGVAEQGLITERYDVFCNGVWPTPTRTKAVFYSRPFIYTPIYVFVSARKPLEGQDLSWLNQPQTTFAVIRNMALDTMVDFKFSKAKKFDVSILSSDAEPIMAVATGKADAGLSNYGSIKKYMDSNPGQIQLIQQPVAYEPSGFLMPQDEKLKHMIDFTLGHLLDTGVIKDILIKNLPDQEHGWRYPAADYSPQSSK